MNLGIISPEDYNRVVEDHGLLAEHPVRWDLIDAPDEAILAIGACAAFEAMSYTTNPTMVFVAAKGAVKCASAALIAEVAARQAAQPHSYEM